MCSHSQYQSLSCQAEMPELRTSLNECILFLAVSSVNVKVTDMYAQKTNMLQPMRDGITNSFCKETQFHPFPQSVAICLYCM